MIRRPFGDTPAIAVQESDFDEQVRLAAFDANDLSGEADPVGLDGQPCAPRPSSFASEAGMRLADLFQDSVLGGSRSAPDANQVRAKVPSHELQRARPALSQVPQLAGASSPESAARL